MDGSWPGEGEDISNDPWPGQEEIGGGDGEQMEPPEEENGSAGSDDATGGDKTAEVSSDSDLSQSADCLLYTSRHWRFTVLLSAIWSKCMNLCGKNWPKSVSYTHLPVFSTSISFMLSRNVESLE